MSKRDRIGAVALVVFAVVAMVGLVLWMDHEDTASARDHEKTLRNVSQACAPLKLVRVVHHGASWSSGPWWEARCSDGSIRTVSP